MPFGLMMVDKQNIFTIGAADGADKLHALAVVGKDFMGTGGKIVAIGKDQPMTLRQFLAAGTNIIETNGLFGLLIVNEIAPGFFTIGSNF